MPLKTLLFAVLFAMACCGALYSPIWGILGYVAHYSIGPERQWWHAPLSPLGIRYSFMLAMLTAAGIIVQWKSLRFGNHVFSTHEKTFLAFLAAVWLSTLLGPDTVGHYTAATIDHPSIKLTKITIFTLMLTHIVTERKNLDRLIWVMIFGTMILGMQAWSTPYRAFMRGRLERVGGPDFSEANFFAAYMASMLWIIGAQFLRSGWRGKVVCFLAGGFTANAIILTRSRGAVVGLAIGAMAALVLAPKQYRKYVVVGLLAAAAGLVYLADDQFFARTSTIAAGEEERDSSAQSRILLWGAGVRMWADHPLGIGAGNFFQTIGSYIPQYAGKDAHSTYIRCLTELGTQGIVLMGALIVSAYLLLRRIQQRAQSLDSAVGDDMVLVAFGFSCALATLLGCCLTVSLIYVEFLWWFLLLPVCLERVLYNLEEDEMALPPYEEPLEFSC